MDIEHVGLRSVALISLLVGCASSPQRQTDAVSNAAPGAPVASAAPTPPAPAPLDAGIAQADAAPLALPIKAEEPATNVVEAHTWLMSRGLSEAELVPFENVVTCELRDVGEPKEPAIVCDSIENVSENAGGQPVFYRVLLHKKLWVVRQKHAVKVLDVTYGISPLDKEDPMSPNILDLELDIDPQGTAAVLHDKPAPRSCADVRAQFAAAREQWGWDRYDYGLVQRLCAGRGAFTWKAGRFVKKAQP